MALLINFNHPPLSLLSGPLSTSPTSPFSPSPIPQRRAGAPEPHHMDLCLSGRLPAWPQPRLWQCSVCLSCECERQQPLAGGGGGNEPGGCQLTPADSQRSAGSADTRAVWPGHEEGQE
ncbi:unnamed protein product [Boreogadus saida]